MHVLYTFLAFYQGYEPQSGYLVGYQVFTAIIIELF